MMPIACRGLLFARILSVLALAAAAVPGLAQQTPQPSPEREIRQQQNQPLNNKPVWDRVREGTPQYTSIPGRETGVLIQTYGETWRQLKNFWVTPIAGWFIAGVIVLIGLFYRWRG